MSRALTCLGVSLCVVLSGAVQADPPVREKVRDIRGKVVRVVPEQNVIVVQNWDQELRRLVPTR